jgi:hypothetical protein
MTLWVVVVCLCEAARAASPVVERVYVERKRTSDLDSSATGYIYRDDGGGPAYLRLGEQAVGQYLEGRGERCLQCFHLIKIKIPPVKEKIPFYPALYDSNIPFYPAIPEL